MAVFPECLDVPIALILFPELELFQTKGMHFTKSSKNPVRFEEIHRINLTKAKSLAGNCPGQSAGGIRARELHFARLLDSHKKSSPNPIQRQFCTHTKSG
jgi:hypothetical protein